MAKQKISKSLSWGMLIFMFVKLIGGFVIFFCSLKSIESSPYKEIASILGIIISMTSGIQISFRNVFKDWTNQD